MGKALIVSGFQFLVVVRLATENRLPEVEEKT